MKSNTLSKIKYIFILLLFLSCYFAAFFVIKWKSTSGDIVDDISLISDYEYAIVFGAAIKDNETPSDILADRIQGAYNLYEKGKIKKVLLSGDGTNENHSEVSAMKEYAKKLGFREEDIEVDSYGINTYNTCYRAKKFFDINSAILVTQKYHLNRSIYLCDFVNINSIGYPSDFHIYKNIKKFEAREALAFVMNWFKVHYYKIKNV